MCCCSSDDVDVVLVCADEATYAHAQTLRRNVVVSDAKHFSLPCFDELSSELSDTAMQLAKIASKRMLSLFLGAGVSIGSGLPGWFGLLHQIEDEFTASGSPEERNLGEECNWDPLMMAAKLKVTCETHSDRKGAMMSLKQRICTSIENNSCRIGLLLSLLVSLPCDSMVTQNYDQLIEKACSCWNIVHEEATRKKQVSVIPYEPQRGAEHWLLKMHGCVSTPEEIVITSEDYERYESSQIKALDGLVQASLMTKHLMFVGFSLSDPNYLRIVEEVRMALRPRKAMAKTD